LSCRSRALTDCEPSVAAPKTIAAPITNETSVFINPYRPFKDAEVSIWQRSCREQIFVIRVYLGIYVSSTVAGLLDGQISHTQRTTKT